MRATLEWLVDLLGSGEGAFCLHQRLRPPHPALRADLSPQER